MKNHRENLHENLDISFNKFRSKLEEQENPFFSKIVVLELDNWWKGMKLNGDYKRR